MENKRPILFALWRVVVAGATMLFIASASAAETVSVPVTAIVSQSIVATPAVTFDFGTIELSTASTTTIQVDASGGALAGVAPTAINNSTICPSVTSGQITVDAPFNMSITVGWPGTDKVTLTNGGTGSIELSAITANSTTLTAGAVAHTGGVQTVINVGGLLTLPTNTPTGTYNGTIDVTLTYN